MLLLLLVDSMVAAAPPALRMSKPAAALDSSTVCCVPSCWRSMEPSVWLAAACNLCWGIRSRRCQTSLTFSGLRQKGGPRLVMWQYLTHCTVVSRAAATAREEATPSINDLIQCDGRKAGSAAWDLAKLGWPIQGPWIDPPFEWVGLV